MKRLKQTYAIALVTASEIIRDKILYNALLFAVLIMGLAFVASNLTFIQPLRVLVNSGVSGIALSLVILGVLLGAYTLNREFERRTIFVALSRPITRGQFLVGKFLGIAGVLALNWALLTLILVLSVRVLFNQPEAVTEYLSTTFWVGMLLVYFQVLIATALSLMFSAMSTTSVAAITTAGLYFVGTNISALSAIGKSLEGETERALLGTLLRVLPNFEFFNLGFGVTYGLPVDWAVIGKAILYGLAWVTGALMVGSILIEKKESN